MAKTFDLESLRILVAIAETESHVRAAEQVHRTQAAVSIRMKRLEEDIGKPLFQKVGRRNILTNEGRLLATHAVRMLRIQDEAMSQILTPEISGTVRVGVPDSYVPTILTDALTGFREAHPQIEIEVLCDNSRGIRHSLASGDLDVGICSELRGKEQGPKILDDRLIWVSSELNQTHELNPVPLAIYPHPSLLNEWTETALKSWGRPHRRVLSSTNLLALHAAVSSGFAVAAIMQSSNTLAFIELSTDDGFPELPKVSVTLHLPKNTKSAAGELLAEHFLSRLAK